MLDGFLSVMAWHDDTEGPPRNDQRRATSTLIG
jgi:hypothetical protein